MAQINRLEGINGIFKRLVVEPKRDLWDVLNGVYPFFTTDIALPEGYELVETDAHKKQRLEASLQENKKLLAYHEKKIQELAKTIESAEKEILQLTK